MTNKTWMAVVVGLGFAAVAGCKGKDKQAASTAGSAAAGSAAEGLAGAGSATGSAAEAGSAAAGSAAPAGSVAIAEGEVKPGCFAWSASKQAAACIVGTAGLGVETELYLAYVGKGGSKMALELAPSGDAAPDAMPRVTAAAAKAASEALARDGFAPLAGAPQPVAADKPVTVNGVMFTLASQQTEKGGDNQPPTTKYTVTAKCNPTVFNLENEGEGLDLSASVRAVDDVTVVIDRHSHVAREGESSDFYQAAVLSKTTCTGFTAD